MLRRIISLIMALCMLLGIGLLAPAASAAEADLFQDANEIQFEEAVDILAALDIIDGAQPLDPEGTLNRAEAATLVAMVCLGDRYSGEEISTMYGKYENPFSDVSAGQWRDGTIAYCARTGIIRGREDGYFDPDGNITGIEYSRILLGALGYGDSVELEIPSDVDMSGDLTTEDGLLMTAAALDQPIATVENGKVTYGETLAERNYGMPFAELRKEISAGTFQLPETEQTEEMERLASNKHYTNYTDRYQSHFRDASRFVVSANMIPTYSAQKLNYILPEEDYTWADAAQFITTLLLGEEEAAKLTDGGMAYCMEEGYIPSDHAADDPITGTDLVKIMCTLLGNFWLDSAAGQFATVYGLLEGVTGKLGTANTELETMEDHTALNALLAEPLNRDNGMQMIYNFLKAKMPNSEETVAEHFGIDLDKYQPKPANAQLAEVYYVTAVDPQTKQTVNVTVYIPPAEEEGEGDIMVNVRPASDTTGYIPEDVTTNEDGVFLTYKVASPQTLTVDTINALISYIMEHRPGTDGDIQEVILFDYDNKEKAEGVSYNMTENGMSVTFQTNGYDVSVYTEPLSTELPGEIPVSLALSPQAEEESGETPAEPSAETPAEPPAETPTETPVESPAAEPPAAEPPVAESPAAETPAAETPVAETPVAEPPAAEPPAAEAPVAEPPAAEPPTGEEPGSE